MAYEESIEQLKSLIEHFNNGGNDFNATDIEAIKYLLKENQELKRELKSKPDAEITLKDNEGKIYQVIQAERIDMQEKLNKSIQQLLKDNQELKEQQKEFIKYLEKRYKDVTSVIGSFGSNTDLLYGKKDMIEEIIQKYKRIIGDDK